MSRQTRKSSQSKNSKADAEEAEEEQHLPEPNQDQNKDIFDTVDDFVYRHTQDQWVNNPAHQFQSTLEQTAGSYFQAEPLVDKHVVARQAQQRATQVAKGGRLVMKQQVLKFYFEKIYTPLQFPAATEERMLSVFRAVGDVSHEVRYGQLQERLDLGLTTAYSQEDLAAAYEIYKQMAKNDLETGTVTLDILKLAKEPMQVYHNVCEREDGFGLPDADSERGREEAAHSLIVTEAEVEIDKEAIRQLALFKAIRANDQESQETIRKGFWTEKELHEFLHQDLHLEALEDFGQRPLHGKKRKPDYESASSSDQDDISTHSRNWNFADGMTKSVFSHNSEKQGVQAMKDAEGDCGPGQRKQQLHLHDIIDNIDELSERASHMVISKNEFLNALREQTKEKILAVRDAKKLFGKRVMKLMKAQQYELQNAENQGIMVAQEVFKEKGDEVREVFADEVTALEQEYREVHNLIGYYEKKVKTQATTIAEQELIISKLQNHISVNMKARAKEDLQENEIIISKSAKIQQVDLTAAVGVLARRQFDFYGGQVRIQTEEKNYFIKNLLLKEKEHEMDQLKDKLDYTRNQNLELMKLSKKASEEASTLKRELHDANADIRQMKAAFKYKHARQAEGFEKMLDNLKFELRRTLDESAQFREYADFEQQVLEVCVTKLEGKCKLYREGGKKLRAVMRIPRLTRLYHDLIRRDGLDEFASLDQVYDLHFKTVGDFSPKRLAETPAVERHLMSRSLNQAIQQNDLVAAPRLRSSLVDEYPRGQQPSPHQERVHRLQTQSMEQRAKNLSSIGVRPHAPSMLEPLSDAQELALSNNQQAVLYSRRQYTQNSKNSTKNSTFKNASSLHRSIDLGGVRRSYNDSRYMALDQLPPTAVNQISQLTNRRGVVLPVPLSTKGTAKPNAYELLTSTARTGSSGIARNWLGTSVNMDSTGDRWTKQEKARFMNDIINQSIDVSRKDNGRATAKAEANLTSRMTEDIDMIQRTRRSSQNNSIQDQRLSERHGESILMEAPALRQGSTNTQTEYASTQIDTHRVVIKSQKRKNDNTVRFSPIMDLKYRGSALATKRNTATAQQSPAGFGASYIAPQNKFLFNTRQYQQLAPKLAEFGGKVATPTALRAPPSKLQTDRQHASFWQSSQSPGLEDSLCQDTAREFIYEKQQ